MLDTGHLMPYERAIYGTENRVGGYHGEFYSSTVQAKIFHSEQEAERVCRTNLNCRHRR
jgi:hypothetical protein